MSRKLSKFEQETIIIFNKADKEAHIFTYERRWQRHLEQKLGLVLIMDNGFGGKEYIISKDRIRMPQLKRKVPDRKAIVNRFKVRAYSSTGH